MESLIHYLTDPALLAFDYEPRNHPAYHTWQRQGRTAHRAAPRGRQAPHRRRHRPAAKLPARGSPEELGALYRGPARPPRGGSLPGRAARLLARLLGDRR